MEGLVKKIKGIRNEMIGLSIVLMLAGIFMILFPNTSGNIICRGSLHNCENEERRSRP